MASISICVFLLLISFAALPLLIHANPSPFEFIKHLEGCHKGKNVKDLHKLKSYLERFGYLNYHNQSHATDDDFDDLLEEAVKTYQLNFHLHATGTLDAKTVSTMTVPRCGVPDIRNGTNSMRGGKKRPGSEHGGLHTVAHFTFFPNTPRWPASKTHLTYGFYPNTPPNAQSAVARAFDKWASTIGYFSFSKSEDFQTADLKVGFGRGNHGDNYPFDGPGGTLAHAYAPTDGRFHYDADEKWAVGSLAGFHDVETVALHEIGHLLGLGHSSVKDAIMYPTIASGVTKGLHGDDVQGIKVLYGLQ